MHASKFALFFAMVSLPAAAVAQSPSPGPTATVPSVAPRPEPTGTVDPVATHHTPPPQTPAPVVHFDCTFTASIGEPQSVRTFPINAFTVKPAPLAQSGIVTVSANRDVLPQIQALETQHAVIAEAVFACPMHRATVANASIASVADKIQGADAVFGFTVDYGPASVRPHPTR